MKAAKMKRELESLTKGIKDKKRGEKKDIELAAERLAEIFVAQIEFQKNKNKNCYEKQR